MRYMLNCSELQIGDIILESGHKLHSRAIQIRTKSNFSHAMICVDEQSLIHAETKGIFTLNPQRKIVKKQTDLKVLRLKGNLSESNKNKIEFFLRTKVGSVYSIKDALLVVEKDKNKQIKSEHQFCSRLVAQAYKHIHHNIVENIDFCSPADIEKSDYLYEVENIVREAKETDITFARTENGVKKNQKSTYKWLNKTRDLAYKYRFSINNINDVDSFLRLHPDMDKTVCGYINKSGYLENFMVEVKNNPHMFNENKFIQKFQDIESIAYALIQEYNIVLSPTKRYRDNYVNSMGSHLETELEYYKLHVNLYQTLLGVSMSKLITLYNVSKKMMFEHSENITFSQIMLTTHGLIESLQELEIKEFDN